MRFGKLIIGLALASVSASSFANKLTASICNGCNASDTQSDARGLGNGDHFYYDMTDRTLTHWSVSGTVIQIARNPGAGVDAAPLTNAVITNVPITATEQNAFNATQTLYDQFGTLSLTGKLTVTTTPPVAVANKHVVKVLVSLPKPQVDQNGKMNAYDVVGTPANMQAALAAAVDASTFAGYVMDSRSNISAFVNNATIIMNYIPNPTTIVEEIDFPDGSYMEITYNYVVRVWQYIPGSAHDSEGNLIPDTLAAVAGAGSNTYKFPAGNAGFQNGLDALQNMQNLGAIIGSKSVSNTSGWIIICTSSPGYPTRCDGYLE